MSRHINATYDEIGNSKKRESVEKRFENERLQRSNIKERVTKHYLFRLLRRYLLACILTTSSMFKSLAHESTKGVSLSLLDLQ